MATGSRWGVDTGVGLGVEISRGAAFTSGSVLASLDSLARHAGSAWVSFPASSPDSALRRCEESQKHAVYSAQAVDYLLALASEFRPAGSLVILGSPESPMALERSDSAGSLCGALGDPPEHFRLATVSVQVSPLASVFRPARRRTARRSGRFRSKQVWWNGLISCSRCIWRSTRSNIRASGEPAPGLTQIGRSFSARGLTPSSRWKLSSAPFGEARKLRFGELPVRYIGRVSAQQPQSRAGRAGNLSLVANLRIHKRRRFR